MKKKKRFFHWKKQGLSIALAVLMSGIHLVPANLELVKADGYEIEQDNLEPSEVFETVSQELDDAENQLTTYQNAMEQLKALLGIINTGSLESQLEEIVTKVEQTLIHLQEIQDEIERQLEGNYEVDTEGLTQLETIFKRIYTLKMYGDNLKTFHDVIQGILGMDSNTTNEEIYQNLSHMKDRVKEYSQFLDKTEQLIHPNGVNGSSALITGEQTREELNQVYAKIEELIKRQDLLSLKELLELNPDGTIEEIYDKISSMKDTMAEYWAYLSQVEEVIQLEDGNHLANGSSIVTGSPVTTRLTVIYERLIVMTTQQESMAERISQLIEREQSLLNENQELAKVNQELEGLQEELMQQREKTNQFLSELKALLGLDHHAENQDIIHAVTNMKETLSEYWNYLGEVEELIQMPDGSGVDQSDIVTGSAVTVRLSGIYDKLTDMVKQQDRMAETIEDFLTREEILTDSIRELNEVLEEMNEQKQQTEYFLKELKSLLGLNEDAGYQDVLDHVSKMRNQITHYRERIEEFLIQLGMTSEEGEQKELSEQLKDVMNQVWNIIHQLTEEIEKSGEAEKKATLLEQKNKELIAENQQLKQKNKELNQNLSSSSSDDSNTEELERKNQQQQERIAELEKNLLSQTEEIERLMAEREQQLEILSDRDRQIEECNGQIGFLTEQLAEKERKIVELEQRLEEQRPIQELLEKNEIDEERLIWMLHRKEEDPNPSVTEKESVIMQKNPSSEESRTQETKECFETTDAEEETGDTVISEIEETSSLNKEETTTAEAETKETMVQEKERQEKAEIYKWISLFLLLLILVLSGSMVLLFKRKKKTKK